MTVMNIRLARPEDALRIWEMIAPAIRAGETLAMPREMPEAEALAYWMGPDRETFVAEEEGRLLGTYYLRANQPGGGSHVANGGYITALEATGRGVAKRMCEDSLERARARILHHAIQFRRQHERPSRSTLAAPRL